MGGRKRLSAEDREVWSRITRQVTPLQRRKPAIEPAQEPPKPHIIPKPTPAIPPVVARPPAPKLTPPAKEAVRMDSKAYRKLKRGKLAPERKLDLHGKHLAQAHSALTYFIRTAHADGLRLVLVITGKGRGGYGDEPGALKRQVPEWLGLPPLKGLVLTVSTAHQSHGGDGAYYVYLRRRR